jgi:hypothetical protein
MCGPLLLLCLAPPADRVDAGAAATSWGDGPSCATSDATAAEMALGSTVVVVVAGSAEDGGAALDGAARWATLLVGPPP